MVSRRLTLREAQETGRLRDFIRQEERRGTGSADASDLESALARIIKSPRSTDRTSRSRGRGGSGGT